MRVKKPSFLKVFERAEERDNRPLLDLKGSLHEASSNPYEPPSSLLQEGNTSNEDTGDDSFVANDQTTRHSPRSDAVVVDGGEDKYRHRKSETGRDIGRNSFNNAGRVGELPRKPRTDEFFMRQKQESAQSESFGGRKMDNAEKRKPSDESSSSSSENDFFYEAGVTTTAGDDDANTFVQFTVGPVSSNQDQRISGMLPVNERNEASLDSLKTLGAHNPQHNSSGKSIQKLLPNSNIDSSDEHAPRPRPRLVASGKSMSSRSLAEHLEKDKPTVDEEIRKILNIKPGRPGLGARKQSDRSLGRNLGADGRPNRRRLVKAVSERNLKARPSHKFSEHRTSDIAESRQAPRKDSASEDADLLGESKGRNSSGHRQNCLDKNQSSQGVKSCDWGDFREADTSTTALSSGKIQQEMHGEATHRKLLYGTTPCMSPVKESVKAENPEATRKKTGDFTESDPSFVQRSGHSQQGGTKEREAPHSPVKRDRRNPIPTPVKSPTRRSRTSPESNGKYTPRTEPKETTKEMGKGDDSKLPIVPLSPNDVKSPHGKKEKRKRRTSTARTRKQKEIVFSWVRCPRSSAENACCSTESSKLSEAQQNWHALNSVEDKLAQDQDFVSKNFSKTDRPTEFLRKKLDDATERLEDAKRLVSRLEEEVARLTNELRSEMNFPA